MYVQCVNPIKVGKRNTLKYDSNIYILSHTLLYEEGYMQTNKSNMSTAKFALIAVLLVGAGIGVYATMEYIVNTIVIPITQQSTKTYVNTLSATSVSLTSTTLITTMSYSITCTSTCSTSCLTESTTSCTTSTESTISIQPTTTITSITLG